MFSNKPKLAEREVIEKWDEFIETKTRKPCPHYSPQQRFCHACDDDIIHEFVAENMDLPPCYDPTMPDDQDINFTFTYPDSSGIVYGRDSLMPHAMHVWIKSVADEYGQMLAKNLQEKKDKELRKTDQPKG